MANSTLNLDGYSNTIYSFSPFGYEGAIVNVETDLRRGIPATDLVGISDSAVKESRERMQAAIRNSGYNYPSERVLISLSPADLKKEGAGFDLPLALSVIKAEQKHENLEYQIIDEPIMVMGELELSGRVRPVKGVHAAAATAKASGINYMIVPEENEAEAKEIPGLKVLGVKNLSEAIEVSKNVKNFQEGIKLEKNDTSKIEFDEVMYENLKKQEKDGFFKNADFDMLRAINIAVAGKHNINIQGAPGCGKTLYSNTIISSLTPKLTTDEAQSVTRIWSLAGLIKPSEPLIKNIPYRIPHQTASIEGICGGGPNCRPGEISLAHNGVLFLDEAAEFRSSVIQMLRVPLEHGSITLSRAGRSTTYPANFQLVMVNNPCPCGNFGSHDKICLDSMKSINEYHKKFGAPLYDRIDVNSFVSGYKPENDTRIITVDEMRENIERAFEIQRKNGIYNSHLSPQEINDICPLTEQVRKELDENKEKYLFSPRKEAASIKVAYTIANMDGRTEININDMKEACSLVRPVYNFDTCEIKQDLYKYNNENPVILAKEKQKEFLSQAHENFSQQVLNITSENNKMQKDEKKLNENLSENEKLQIIEESKKDSEETKRINERNNINTNSKRRSK